MGPDFGPPELLMSICATLPCATHAVMADLTSVG